MVHNDRRRDAPGPFASGKVKQCRIVREDGCDQDLVAQHAVRREGRSQRAGNHLESCDLLLLVQIGRSGIIRELEDHGSHDGDAGVGCIDGLGKDQHLSTSRWTGRLT
jgi:hypothetical protein